MRRLTLLVATIVTITLFSSMPLLAAHSAEYPDSPICPGGALGNFGPGGGKFGVIVYYRPLAGTQQKITTAERKFSGACTTGATVVGTLSHDLCVACNPLCAAADPVADASFICTVGGVARFTVLNSQTASVGLCSNGIPCPATAVVADAAAGHILVGINRTTDAGNEMRVDLLPDLQVQITPRGVDGNVVFHVELGPSPGQGPSFTVNTTSKKPAQIHQEIAAGFKAMGYPASQVSNGDISGKSQDPQLFSGPSVRVSNIGTLNGSPVKYVSVQGAPHPSDQNADGMLVEVENSEPVPLPFPAVSEWTIALFIGLVLLMGTWLLRRRLTTQAV